MGSSVQRDGTAQLATPSQVSLELPPVVPEPPLEQPVQGEPCEPLPDPLPELVPSPLTAGAVVVVASSATVVVVAKVVVVVEALVVVVVAPTVPPVLPSGDVVVVV